MNELPVLRQLLLCEKVIFEQGSGNASLINCFSVRLSDRFPTRPVSFVLYGLLANGSGPFTIQVRISRPDTGAPVFQQSFPMLFSDRLRASDLVCRVNDLIFPVEGSYQFDLLADQESLGITTALYRRRLK